MFILSITGITAIKPELVCGGVRQRRSLLPCSESIAPVSASPKEAFSSHSNIRTKLGDACPTVSNPFHNGVIQPQPGAPLGEKAHMPAIFGRE
jgi:hypothetical protein